MSDTPAPTQTNVLQFPPDYDATSGLWFTLIEYNYSRPTISADFKAVSTGTTISLPIPNNFGASYNAKWGEETMSATKKLMVDSLENMVHNAGGLNKFVGGYMANRDLTASGFLKDVGSVIDGLAKRAVTGGAALGKAAASDILTGVPYIEEATAAAGLARNPWLAATFTGVGFRTFSYNYDFFPKSLNESKTIEKIFKALKFGMHPSYDGSFDNHLFRYPSMYWPVVSDPTYLFDFGFCVITGVDINYHKEGRPLYFNDNGTKVPASMSLKFDLLEIEVVTRESLGGSGQGVNQEVANALANRKDGKVVKGR